MSVLPDGAPPQRRTIAILGDIFMDIVASRVNALPSWGGDCVVDNVTSCLGGSAANTARHLASLNDGSAWDVYLLGAVGLDANGKEALRVVNESGLMKWNGDDAVATVEGHSTGTCIVLSGDSDRAFVSCNGANDAFDPLSNPAALAVLQNADHIHVHGYYNCRHLQGKELASFIRQQKEAKGAALSVSLDTQYDGSHAWLRENLLDLLSDTSFFLPNETEAEGIASNVLKNRKADSAAAGPLELFAAQYPDMCTVVKSGAAGSVTYDPPQPSDFLRHPASPVASVVDTTGAGDAFTAAFLHRKLIQGGCMHTALQRANRAGAVCVQRLGACSPPIVTCDVAQEA